MLILLLSFADFNPHNVMSARKTQLLTAINDIALVCESDSFSLSYFWKNGYDLYRIDVRKKGEDSYYLIYDEKVLWKVIKEKKRKEEVSFLEYANLWMFDWLYFLPDNFKWKGKDNGLALLEFDYEKAHISLWVDNEGKILRVKIDSEFRKMEIEYKDFRSLWSFPNYPYTRIIKSEDGEREFKVTRALPNMDFCTPCTFKIPRF